MIIVKCVIVSSFNYAIKKKRIRIKNKKVIDSNDNHGNFE